MCAKVHTVAASNNRDSPTMSLSSSSLARVVNCSTGWQALLEVTHQDHSIGVTLLLLVRATYIYCFSSRAHPVRGESHIQRNATGEVAIMPTQPDFKTIPDILTIEMIKNIPVYHVHARQHFIMRNQV